MGNLVLTVVAVSDGTGNLGRLVVLCCFLFLVIGSVFGIVKGACKLVFTGWMVLFLLQVGYLFGQSEFAQMYVPFASTLFRYDILGEIAKLFPNSEVETICLQMRNGLDWLFSSVFRVFSLLWETIMPWLEQAWYNVTHMGQLTA